MPIPIAAISPDDPHVQWTTERAAVLHCKSQRWFFVTVLTPLPTPLAPLLTFDMIVLSGGYDTSSRGECESPITRLGLGLVVCTVITWPPVMWSQCVLCSSSSDMIEVPVSIAVKWHRDSSGSVMSGTAAPHGHVVPKSPGYPVGPLLDALVLLCESVANPPTEFYRWQR